MALALFDLDNTLIAGDSDHAWGEFLAEQEKVDAKQYRHENDRFYQLYQQGQLNIEDYLQFALQPLANLEPNELRQLRQTFIAEKIIPMRLPKAEGLLAQHKKAGDTVAIITSTNRFITEPIASLLGVEHLMATELEIQDTRFTGQIIGEPCYRAGKILHLQRWLSNHPYAIENSFFYSDSINDLPLLELVNTAIAVDPDPVLREHAEAQAWSIISLRS